MLYMYNKCKITIAPPAAALFSNSSHNDRWGVCLLLVVGWFRCVHSSSLALQGASKGGFCNGVVSGVVAKPGELSSFHR